MKKFFALLFLMGAFAIAAIAQDPNVPYYIKNYEVKIKVNKDASLSVSEIIDVYFNEQRHGIIRSIPYKYEIQPLPNGTDVADRQMVSGNSIHTILSDVKVAGKNFDVSSSGDNKDIKIGSADSYVSGNQQYEISYKIENAINFFDDGHSEFYFNLIGDKWDTYINAVHFSVELYAPLPDTTEWFIATGSYGSRGQAAVAFWKNKQEIEGHTIARLNSNEGLTVGFKMPKDFLVKPDYSLYGIYWILLPFLAFFGMYKLWQKYGKDEKLTITTEFYPPENVSPSVSGYIIDDKLDRRDLTALIPYWGAGGYLRINETENKALFGLIKTNEYEFVKLKELSATAMVFEKTLFNGIFATGDKVLLSDLKDVLYTTMEKAKKELESEIDVKHYYVKYSRGLSFVFPFIGLIILVAGIVQWASNPYQNRWLGISLLISGIIIIVFGLLMRKKTETGTLLYQKLLGFREFVKSVEKDRLQEFLKQDEHYFDKILPYAIVFDMADKWKDKLKGLNVPPPTWYSGAYAGANFNTMMFMNSLDKSMNAMSSSFYSAPQSSGSSGGSFSGGGGFSGGGFGGGGGSSW